MKKLEDFEAAVRKHEMLGSMPPGDWEGIEQDYLDAKEALERVLEQAGEALFVDAKRRKMRYATKVPSRD